MTDMALTEKVRATVHAALGQAIIDEVGDEIIAKVDVGHWI